MWDDEFDEEDLAMAAEDEDFSCCLCGDPCDFVRVGDGGGGFPLCLDCADAVGD